MVAKRKKLKKLKTKSPSVASKRNKKIVIKKSLDFSNLQRFLLMLYLSVTSNLIKAYSRYEGQQMLPYK